MMMTAPPRAHASLPQTPAQEPAVEAVAKIDLEHILVTDSAEEAVQMARDAALRQFGLSYGPKIKRRWFLWE